MDLRLNTGFTAQMESLPSSKTSTQQPQKSVESTSGSTSLSAIPTQTPEAIQQVNGVSSSEHISQALQDINKTLQFLSVGVEFSQDQDTDKTVIKVIDKQTKDVIRQIPSETVLEISKALDKIQGMLIDETA